MCSALKEVLFCIRLLNFVCALNTSRRVFEWNPRANTTLQCAVLLTNESQMQTHSLTENLCVIEQQWQWEPHRFYYCLGVRETTKHNAIIVHNDIGLEAITTSWRFYEKPNKIVWLLCIGCAIAVVRCARLRSVSLRIRLNHGCFIHNNLCYCVLGHHFGLYCFGLVLSVASMWWTDESQMCVFCVLEIGAPVGSW